MAKKLRPTAFTFYTDSLPQEDREKLTSFIRVLDRHLRIAGGEGRHHPGL